MVARKLRSSSGAEPRVISGARARLLVVGGVEPAEPLRQHAERAAGLLVLRQRLPFALEHRERGGVERIAGGETIAQHFARAAFGEGWIDRGPLRRQLGAAFEAPVGVGFRDLGAGALGTEVFEQAAADDLADLGFVVGDQVARDALDDLGDAVLPVLLVVRSFRPRSSAG